MEIMVLGEDSLEMIGVPVGYQKNPLFELDENNLHVLNDAFLTMDQKPITQNNGLMREVHDITTRYKDRCNRSKNHATLLWRQHP